MNLSIIIPCFNEPINIVKVINQFEAILARSSIDAEVIIVDGASTDSTQDVLRERSKTLDKTKFKFILKEKRGGYGKDIMEGLQAAQGFVLAWTHADLQTDPEDVFKGYDLLIHSNKNTIIKGKRRKRRFMEAFFTFGMQIFTWIFLRVYLDDINAQPKVFHKDFYEKFLKEGGPDDFSLDLFLLYKAKINKFKIKTFPVHFKKRMHGEAKGGGGGWKDRLQLIKRTFKYILKLREKVS